MTQTKKYIFMALGVVFVLSGCGALSTQMKDIPIEQMDQLEDEYVGRKAWTRTLLIDTGQNGIIDRDVEVKIVSIDMHWNGAVGVKGPDRKVVRHNLDLQRPLTKEKFEAVLDRAFWFKEPDYRYRMNLNTFGKRTAKAIYSHELFKNMPREAALHSWGFPDEMKSSDIGETKQEQWTYRDPRERNKKRYVWLIDDQVDRWEE